MVAQLMAQPFKHPKTGGYYYRRVVPAHLREALGRTEFRISLKTKDLREAKRRYPEKAAEVDAALARAGGGPVNLTNREVYALAGVWYRRMVDKHEAEPGDPLGWDFWADELRDAYHEDRVAAVIRPQVDELLKREGLIVDEPSRKRLDEAVLVNAIELAEKLIDRAQGDYSPDPHLETIPEWRGANGEKRVFKDAPVSTIFVVGPPSGASPARRCIRGDASSENLPPTLGTRMRPGSRTGISSAGRTRWSRLGSRRRPSRTT